MSDTILRTAVFISSHPIKGTGSRPEISGLHTETRNGFKAIIFGDLQGHVSSFDEDYVAVTRPSVEQLENLVGIKFTEVDLVVLHLDAEYYHGAKVMQEAEISGHKVIHAVCERCCFEEAQILIPDFHRGSFAVPVDCGPGPRLGHLIKRWWISGHITKFKGSVAHTHPHFLPAHL